MKKIGIEDGSGDSFENVGNYRRLIWPQPMVSEAIIDPDFPPQFAASPLRSRHVFREDSFDPMIRIRRGRFYQLTELPRPSQTWAFPLPIGGIINDRARADGLVERRLFIYDQLQIPLGESTPKLVALGVPESLWRVLACERITTSEYLFTLRARHAFGILPEIDPDRIPAEGRTKAIEELDTLTDAAHRESPASVVDRARAAAQWCLGTWAAYKYDDTSQRLKDLGAIIRFIRGKTQNNMISTDAANVIRVLHSRAKPNEQEARDLRPVWEDDAELAVQLMAFMLRDFGWVREQ